MHRSIQQLAQALPSPQYASRCAQVPTAQLVFAFESRRGSVGIYLDAFCALVDAVEDGIIVESLHLRLLPARRARAGWFEGTIEAGESFRTRDFSKQNSQLVVEMIRRPNGS